jgi:hypothetical protein
MVNDRNGLKNNKQNLPSQNSNYKTKKSPRPHMKYQF